jgi:hypothetical protein
MELADALRLEHYKFVIERQKYFTGLARDAFASYSKLFSGLVAGGVALVSAKDKLSLKPEVLNYLVEIILYLATFLAFVASAQILFCLARWRHFRGQESAINCESPPVHRSWWVFESLYILAILVTVCVAWFVAGRLPKLLVKA